MMRIHVRANELLHTKYRKLIEEVVLKIQETNKDFNVNNIIFIINSDKAYGEFLTQDYLRNCNVIWLNDNKFKEDNCNDENIKHVICHELGHYLIEGKQGQSEFVAEDFTVEMGFTGHKIVEEKDGNK